MADIDRRGGIHIHAWSQARMFGSLEKENPMLSILFPVALQNEELFAAMVACSRAHFNTRNNLDSRNNPEVWHYYGKALGLLKRKLAACDNAVDDAMIFTGIHFLGIHYLAGDAESFAVHLSGLRCMIRAKSGPGDPAVEKFIRTYISHAASFSSLLSDQLPVRKTSIRVRQPRENHAPPLERGFLVEGLNPGFRSLADVGLLNDFTAKKIYEMSRVYGETCTNTPIDTRLLPQLLRAARKNAGGFQECLHLGLLLCHLNYYNQSPHSPSYWRILRTLATVARGLTDLTLSERECMIWILTIAADSARRALWHDQQHFSFMTHMFHEYPESQYQTWWLRILRKFMWHEGMAEGSELCYNEAREEMSHRLPPGS